MVMGREVRTVKIDPEQAPLVRQAFELYATGDYSLRALHERLTVEGLATRPTAKRPGGPLALSKFANLLRNRYYLGVVPYRGVEHAGKHPALIGAELFERVQQVLDERDQHSIKTRRHTHYLRGLLNCARCGARLQYTTGRNRHGSEFDYYVCSGRHRGQGCDLPYLAAFEVERRIERAWPLWVRLDELGGESVGEQLHKLIVGKQDHGARLARAQRTLARLDTERRKLVQMAYADAIPLDLLKSEQARITREREQAEREAAQAGADGKDVMATYNQARDLMQRGAAVYVMGGPEVRRLLNRAFIMRIEVDAEEEQGTLASPWREIRDAAAYVRTNDGAIELSQVSGRPKAAGRSSKANPGLIFEVRGSTMNPLVELRGFEPLTSSMPWKRATNCAKAPR
jgi:site-specific DNA recombinase